MEFNTSELKAKLERFLKSHLNVKSAVIALGILTLLSFTFVILIKTSHERNFGVLYTHLSPDDAGSVLTVLQENHIPYRVEGDGSIILVPKDRVYDVRLKLAAKGIPRGKVVGFEIFEEPKLGITQFQENIEYLRALEGELTRTIERIDAVRQAKVNIAIPKESIFVREEEEPKASVIVNLWPGKELTGEQVKAIIFLVSHSVPKLKPENVAVVDSTGRVLSDLLEEKVAGSKNMEVKHALERQIERKVQTMLARALGTGKVVVRASVEVETGKMEHEEEVYDPDRTAIVSERKIQNKETSTSKTPQGVPGTSTNVPPTMPPKTSTSTTTKESKDVTTNYDVTKTVEKRVAPIFRIKRISVGVLIDGKYKKVKGKDGKVTLKFIPRTPEELQTYENLVKSVIGFDKSRGDQVTVVSVPFETQREVIPPKPQKRNLLIVGAAVASAFLILLSLVAVKLLKGKKPPEVHPEIVAEIEAKRREKIEEMHIESEPAYLKIVEVAEKQPEIIAGIVSRWIKEEGVRK